MFLRSIIGFLFISLLCVSCSKKVIEKSTIEETNLELQMIEAYTEGMKELERRCQFAAKNLMKLKYYTPKDCSFSFNGSLFILLTKLLC